MINDSDAHVRRLLSCGTLVDPLLSSTTRASSLWQIHLLLTNQLFFFFLVLPNPDAGIVWGAFSNHHVCLRRSAPSWSRAGIPGYVGAFLNLAPTTAEIGTTD